VVYYLVLNALDLNLFFDTQKKMPATFGLRNVGGQFVAEIPRDPIPTAADAGAEGNLLKKRNTELIVLDVKEAVYRQGIPNADGSLTIYPFPSAQILVIDGEPAADDQVIPKEMEEVTFGINMDTMDAAKNLLNDERAREEFLLLCEQPSKKVPEKWQKVFLKELLNDTMFARQLVNKGLTGSDIFAFFSEKVRADRETAMGAVMRHGDLFKHAGPELRADQQLFVAALAGTYGRFPFKDYEESEVFQFAAPELRADPKMVSLVLNMNGLELEHASAEIQADPKIVLDAVRGNGDALRFASAELRADPRILVEAAANVYDVDHVLEYAPPEVRADPKILLAVLNVGPLETMSYAPLELRADPAFMLAAVNLVGSALSHASWELRSSAQIVLAAVAQNGKALQFASPDLQANFEIVRVAVGTSGLALEFASLDLRAHREVVQAAVENKGAALRFAAAELQADRGIVQAAVTQSGTSLQFAAPPLREDRELVTTAVKQFGPALEFASDALRGDRQIVQAALQCRGSFTSCAVFLQDVLRHVADEFYGTPVFREMLATEHLI